MEGALGDAGEDLHHGVGSVRVVHVDEVQNFGAIGHEDPTKEGVDEVHLTNHIHKVQHVTEKIPEKVMIKKNLIALRFRTQKVLRKRWHY